MSSSGLLHRVVLTRATRRNNPEDTILHLEYLNVNIAVMLTRRSHMYDSNRRCMFVVNTSLIVI
jgi:hypothetical protein